VRLKTDWEPALSNTLCKQIKPLSEVKPEMHITIRTIAADTSFSHNIYRHRTFTYLIEIIDGALEQPLKLNWRHQRRDCPAEMSSGTSPLFYTDPRTISVRVLYACRVVCCPLVSLIEYATRALLRSDKKMGQTNRRTPDRYITLTARRGPRDEFTGLRKIGQA